MDTSSQKTIPYTNYIGDDQSALQSYFSEIQSYPLLEADKEYQLAKKWFETQDPEAAKKLITSHLRLVTKIASGYRGYGLPIGDLIAEGNLGILQAMKKFDPEKGFRFSTYAMWWIKAAIQDYILKSWSLVKIGTTNPQKKLFFNLRRLRRHLNLMDDVQSIPSESIAHIAKELQVPEKDVREMEQRLALMDASLNSTVSGEEEGVEWQDWIEVEGPNQEEVAVSEDEQKKQHKVLEDSLKKLLPRELQIIRARRLKDPPDTLDKIAKALNISKERVRQLEVRAFRKLRDSIRGIALKNGWIE